MIPQPKAKFGHAACKCQVAKMDDKIKKPMRHHNGATDQRHAPLSRPKFHHSRKSGPRTRVTNKRCVHGMSYKSIGFIADMRGTKRKCSTPKDTKPKKPILINCVATDDVPRLGAFGRGAATNAARS